MQMFQNENLKKINQRGFTLIELGVVVAIGFLLVGIGLYKAPTIMANYRVNAELQELPQIVTNIQKSYVNSPSFVGVSLDSIIRLDAFPQNRVTIPGAGAATATNRWNGAVTFAPGTITTANDIGRMVSAAIPASECKNVVVGAAQMFRRVFVDSANSATVGAGTIVKADGLPLDPTALGTACSGAINSITYDFAK